MFLGTTNSLVSPQIDLERCSLETFSNRINSEITNYATDPRVNTLFEDPNACQYISKEITLENPASSIRIMLDAHVNQVSDIRAFYSTSGDPGFEPIFTPFPGFANISTQEVMLSIKQIIMEHQIPLFHPHCQRDLGMIILSSKNMYLK